jgi:hypothetical protein
MRGRIDAGQREPGGTRRRVTKPEGDARAFDFEKMMVRFAAV